jgi:hypothetical protein
MDVQFDRLFLDILIMIANPTSKVAATYEDIWGEVLKCKCMIILFSWA